MVQKRILFILGVLDSGGVAKSLVSLLNVIDRKKYDVSLLLCSAQMGPFAELLPDGIHIITNKTLAAVGSIKGLKYLLLHGHFLLFFGSLLRLAVSFFNKAWSGYILSRLMPAIPGEWDLIVDYNGQQQAYYMVDKLKAKKKVTFFHSDYAVWPYYFRFDKKYYPKIDAIFTISKICRDSLLRFFPAQADKIHIIENISSVDVITSMSEESFEYDFHSELTLVSVGHICEGKGTRNAIKCAKILKESGVDFKWLFVGNKQNLTEYDGLIDECGVKDCLIFVGTTINPYKYVKNADIFVHCAEYEGKSIALDEAKILCKPIVVTNFSTVRDQFEDGVNANIVEKNPEAIAAGIVDLIDHNDKMASYRKWLMENRRDNTSEVEKIYRLLDN